MSVLSYEEDTGLELFIERLTNAQKVDISKKFEIYRSQYWQAFKRVVQPRLHKSSLPSLVMHTPKERVMNPLNLMLVKIQGMESLPTSSKPSQLSGKRPRVSILLKRNEGQGKRAQPSKGTGLRKKPRTEPKGKSTKAGKGSKRVRVSDNRTHKQWGE